jgi:squalene-hopene/tetraprenyl-beta-curcumene cyclase
MFARLLSIGVWVLAVAGAASAAPPVLDAKQAAAARAAVDRGLDFLRKQQAADGSYGNHVGLTAMTLLALAGSYHHYERDDGPFVSLATDWLVKQQRPDGAISGDATPTYNTALAIMALKAVSAHAFDKQIAAGQAFLVRDMTDEGEKVKPADKYYGGMGYGAGEERPDLSNLQFGLEALKATDFDPNSDVWKKAQVFLNRCQNRSESNDQSGAGNDGGFVYAPDKSMAGDLKSYGAMTFAGLKSLIFTGAKKDDPRVQAAWQWIRANYGFDDHPGLGTVTYYYYLQTAATALDAYGEPLVPDPKGRGRNWAADLTARLVSLQRPDGSWINDNPKYWEGNPILATTRAVVALNHALHAAGQDQK